MDTRQTQEGRSQQAHDKPQSEQQKQQRKSPLRNWLYWLLLAALTIWNVWLFWPVSEPPRATIPYSAFLAQVRDDNVRQVTIQGADISGQLVEPVVGAVLQGTPTAATPVATPAATPPHSTPART